MYFTMVLFLCRNTSFKALRKINLIYGFSMWRLLLVLLLWLLFWWSFLAVFPLERIPQLGKQFPPGTANRFTLWFLLSLFRRWIIWYFFCLQFCFSSWLFLLLSASSPLWTRQAHLFNLFTINGCRYHLSLLRISKRICSLGWYWWLLWFFD